MVETQLTIRGDEWTKYLNFFQKSITFLMLEDVTSGKVVDTNAIEEIKHRAFVVAKQYYDTVKVNEDDLFKSTALGMSEYVNFYEVYPKEGEHDEFKGIYFTGMAVSKLLVTVGLLDLNKYHLKAVLGLMDFRLENPHKISRKLLTERIKSMIDNNVLEAHLGKYGWYLTYKCLFNSVNERAAATL